MTSFPKPEIWIYENGDEVVLYSYHHIRAFELDREINGMSRERFRQPDRNVTGQHRCAISMDIV